MVFKIKEDLLGGAFNYIILRCARIITHNKTVKLNATTYALTNLMPFSPMSLIRCVMRTHQLLDTEKSNDYLPSILSSNSITTRNISGCEITLPKHTVSSDTTCFSYIIIIINIFLIYKLLTPLVD